VIDALGVGCQAGRDIGHATDRGDAQSALPRDDRSRDRAHADRIRTPETEGPDFGRGFVAGTTDGQIHALMQSDLLVSGGGDQESAQVGVVRGGEIHKPLPARPLRTPKGIGADEIQVIREGHEIAGSKAPADAARCIGEQNRGDTEGCEDADRERDHG